MKYRLLVFILVLCILAAFCPNCDKGLAPPPGEGTGYFFPRPPEGGNPMGEWVPDTTDAVEVHFLAQVPADSVHFETQFEGLFSFEQTYICSVNAVLGFKPIIFNSGDTLPLEIVVTDTVRGQGLFEIQDEKVLVLPINSRVFNFSALGFNGGDQSLELLSQSLEYVYEGFYTLKYYLVLHLIRKE